MIKLWWIEQRGTGHKAKFGILLSRSGLATFLLQHRSHLFVIPGFKRKFKSENWTKICAKNSSVPSRPWTRSTHNDKFVAVRWKLIFGINLAKPLTEMKASYPEFGVKNALVLLNGPFLKFLLKQEDNSCKNLTRRARNLWVTFLSAFKLYNSHKIVLGVKPLSLRMEGPGAGIFCPVIMMTPGHSWTQKLSPGLIQNPPGAIPRQTRQ